MQEHDCPLLPQSPAGLHSVIRAQSEPEQTYTTTTFLAEEEDS